MRDQQGREILTSTTTMREAFLAARGPFQSPAVVAMVSDALVSRRGFRKVPAWTVTRREGKRR